MGNRWRYPRTHRARVLINVSASFRLLLSPRETLRLLTAVGVVGTILALPANALISPTAAVGATPGSFAVSPSGAATYTIPIVVPPGVNGLQPNLALTYNSQAGNGLLGMGWGLSGLSVIHRCGATIEIDGFKGGVNYDAADRLCLDGERLIGVGGNEYRTERESLQKVLASDPTANPVWLTVTSPDGTVREYAVPIEAAGNPSLRRLWVLSKIRDKNGNTITFNYDKSDVAAHGDYRPSSISYADNGSASNAVVFQYGPRNDVTPLYEGGSVTKTLKLLTNVASYANGTKVREYRLSYDAQGAVGRSRLVSVQECGTDSACLPATTFGYGSFAEGWSTNSAYAPPTPITHWTGTDNIDYGVRIIDVTGDGLPDYLQCETAGNCRAWVNTGNGWTANTAYAPPTPITHWTGTDNIDYGVRIIDVTGDGLPDYLQCETAGHCKAWLNTGSGWVANTAYAPPTTISNWSGSANINSGVEIIDVTGDGLPDYLQCETAGYCRAWINSANPQSSLLQSVHTGLEITTNITYKPLTDKSIYTKDAGFEAALYPYMDVQAPLYVVSSVSSSNGAGGANTNTYRYGGLKHHHLANRSLGFHWTSTTDPTGATHITHYNQSRENGIDGTIYESKTYAATSGVRINQVVNFWINRAPNGNCSLRPQAQLSSSTETIRELSNNTDVTVVTITNTYDTCGYPTQTVVDMGGGHKKTTVNQYTHDTTNWRLGLVTRTDATSESPGQTPQTRVATFAYDALGRLAAEVIEPGQSALSLTTTYGYDTFGNRIAKTVSGPDIETRTESQTFDARGQFVVAKTNALGHTSTFDYDSRNGQPTRIIDPNGLMTEMDYDGFGRKGLEIRPDGVTTRITYSATSGGYAIQTQTDGAGDIYAFYDMLGRPVRTSTQAFGGNWIYQDTTYDALGRVAQKTHPYLAGESTHSVTYSYDVLGRVKSATEPGSGSRTTTTVYDGLTTTVTNPLGQSKTAVKDVQGRTIEVTDNAGTVSYQHDAVGNLTQVTGVDGAVTAMQYDPRGRKIAMQDPDMGSWTYSYDVLGQLKSQRDAKGQTINMTYDKLGRMLTKTTPEATNTWIYDTAALGSTGRAALGKLASATKSDDNYSEAYTYDNLGRTKTSTINASGTHTVTYDYDAYGRTEYLTYPNTAFKVRNRYDAFGYLYQVARAKADGTESLLWQASAADAHARITQEMFGNGLVGSRVYNHETGDLETIQTGTAASPASIQNLSYTFDALDNLVTRTDAVPGLTETFDYDNLNRLTRATATGSTSVSKTYAYSANGNLTSKSDVGTYTYGGPRPHAVTQIQGTINTTYTYDANGNLLSGGGRTIAYTAFNKPKTIFGASDTTNLYYDVNDNRYLKSTDTKDILYVGKLYERVVAGGLTEHKHYIYGGSALVATYTERNNGTPPETRYVHTDHLGSINVLTDADGNVTERLSFDPHGKRRNPDGSDATTTITSSINRGYTRHEHDDEVGLINMNARLYDPVIGRFITPDTIVQAAGDSQAYNRYSYVRNNPLSLTDPSGHSWLSKGWRRLKKNVKRLTTKIVDKVSSVKYIGGLLRTGLLTNLGFGAAYGWSTGNWKAVGQAHVQGAIMTAQAYTFNWVGGQFPTGINNVMAHGIVGGTYSKLQGGSFGSGFISGGIGSIASPYIRNVSGGLVGQTVAAGVLGGVTAKITGGRFEDGAVVSAAGHLFNYCGHHGCDGGAGESAAQMDGAPNGDWENPSVTEGDMAVVKGMATLAGGAVGAPASAGLGVLATSGRAIELGFNIQNGVRAGWALMSDLAISGGVAATPAMLNPAVQQNITDFITNSFDPGPSGVSTPGGFAGWLINQTSQPHEWLR